MTALVVAVLVRALLLAVRVAPTALVVPFFGDRAVPLLARWPAFAVLVLGGSPALLDPTAVTVSPMLLGALVRELAVGIALAAVLGAPFFAVQYAGRLLDALRTPAGAPRDPDGPLETALRWTFAMTLLLAGGLRAIVRVVATSLAAFPPDPARALGSLDPLTLVASRWTADALAASVTLAGAGWLALLLTEIVVALASRVSPALAQAQPALPVRALVPLAAVALTLGVVTRAAQELARQALAAGVLVGR